MISFPVLQTLTIEQYKLFPISLEQPFRIQFKPGPNAIVGVNGSGKSTLVNIALRCLTGPSNLPAPTSESELGQIRPRIVPMPRSERQMFASRVADNAERATATLVASFGDKSILIKRQLSDLSLLACSVSDRLAEFVEAKTHQNEQLYQDEMATCTGVGTFFDALIVFHFLVFMLEDRRALVWDQSAQRQIFRVLLLPSERAAEYANAQQEIISRDSTVRNLTTIISRQKGKAGSAKKGASTIADAEAERRVLAAESNVLRDKVEAVSQARVQADKERHSARLDRLKAAEARDSIVRELERLKMESLGALLGPSQETLRYIVAQLLAEHRCVVCGTDPSPAAEQIDARIKSGQCPVCGSKYEAVENVAPITEVHKRRIARLETELEYADEQIAAADARISVATDSFSKSDEEFEKLERQRVALDLRIVEVLKRIPAERAAAGSQDTDIDALRRVLSNERRKLTTSENRFRKIVSELVKQVQTLQEEIAQSFKKYLQLFLKERADLVYQTTKDRVGQSGANFDFPGFHLTMTAGAVAGQTMRDNPSQVSQSQAEFIDLAFRMALMSVVADGGAATLFVDAPEASLDFLFAERAGKQLASFSRANRENRVIVTSYLPSRHLLSKFLEGVGGVAQRRDRIVDLIQLAAPNAATRADRAQYEAFLANIIAGRGG
jgi:rubrerythrin